MGTMEAVADGQDQTLQVDVRKDQTSPDAGYHTGPLQDVKDELARFGIVLPTEFILLALSKNGYPPGTLFRVTIALSAVRDDVRGTLLVTSRLAMTAIPDGETAHAKDVRPFFSVENETLLGPKPETLADIMAHLQREYGIDRQRDPIETAVAF